ncbi:hypothetical protein APSETT444_009071 [Aspergillus pseudonomiae]
MTTTIRPAAPDEIPAIVHFIMAARADMFSMLDPSLHLQKAQRELANFQQSYLEHPDGAFFTARVDGRLVATVGYVAYDQRFPQLDFGHERVVEVLRIFWEQQGFSVVHVDDDPVWRTTHMSRCLPAGER